jgi:uncharacterized membrane protein
MRMDMATKVYGLRRAMRTIRFMKGIIAMLAAFILSLPYMVKGYHETAT